MMPPLPSLKDILLGIPSVSAAQWQALSLPLRWLVASRASVLPLTLFAVIFALLLAQPQNALQGWLSGLILLSLLLAHATNNLLNDYVDFSTGLDQDNYFRAQYGAHVLTDGLMSRAKLRHYIYFTGSAAALSGAVVLWFSPPIAWGFAAAGAFLVLFYTYPMKRFALGEVAVFLAWGPLMVAGIYAVLHAAVPNAVIWAGCVYGLGPAVVIFAKHTDKAAADRSKGVYTLPVLLGDHLARCGVGVLLILQICGAVAVAWVYELYGLLLLLGALPAGYKLLWVLTQPIPDNCPEDYPPSAWPLWYTTHAFVYARNAGFWLSMGLLGQIFWPM